MKDEKELAVVEAPAQAMPAVQTVNLNPKAARAAVRAMTEVRAILDTYVKANLAEGVDYGPAYPGASKNTLLKPGSEKMAQLFNLRAEFFRDDLCREMAGTPEKAYFFVCRLVDRSGNVWGEGRGACAEDVARRRDANSAIKIAEKRAQMDAILRAFALSDRFTQDMEDGDYAPPAKATQIPVSSQVPTTSVITVPASGAPVAAAPPAAAPRPAGVPTEKQLTFLHTLLSQYGMPAEKFLEAYKIASSKLLTREQCSKAIDTLKKRVDAGEKWTGVEAPKTHQDGPKPPEGAGAPPAAPAASQGAKQATGAVPVNKVEIISGFDKRIHMASAPELSDIEGEVRLDPKMDDGVRKIVVGFIEARKTVLAGAEDLVREFAGQ